MKQKTLLLINPVIQTTRDCPMMDSDALMQAIVRSKRKIFSRPVIWRKADHLDDADPELWVLPQHFSQRIRKIRAS